MQIKEFLLLPHRFAWGGDGRAHPHDPQGRIYNDCTTFCASWAEQLTGIDIAADLRGTYSTEDGAHAIVEAAGGQVSFVGNRLSLLGFETTAEPQDGAIGVIRAPSALGQFTVISAIRFGPLWAALGRHGVAARRAECIAAWRL